MPSPKSKQCRNIQPITIFKAGFTIRRIHSRCIKSVKCVFILRIIHILTYFSLLGEGKPLEFLN